MPCQELRAANADPMELAIEVNAEDVTKDDGGESESETRSTELDEGDQPASTDELCYQFKCEPKDLKALSDAIEERSFSISSASVEYLPKTLVQLDERSYEKAVRLTHLLSELEEVVEIYDNFALQVKL